MQIDNNSWFPTNPPPSNKFQRRPQQDNSRRPPRNNTPFRDNSQRQNRPQQDFPWNPTFSGNPNRNNQPRQQPINNNNSQPPQNSTRKGECFKCGDPNHWARACPNNNQNKGTSGNQRKPRRRPNFNRSPNETIEQSFMTSDGQESVLITPIKPPCTFCSSALPSHNKGDCYKYSEEYIAMDRRMRQGFWDNLRQKQAQRNQQHFLDQ